MPLRFSDVVRVSIGAVVTLTYALRTVARFLFYFPVRFSLIDSR